jgi:hypothetical protein
MIAASLQALDAGWYATALGAPVVAAVPEELAFSGAAAEMARVRLEYDGEGGPATVIAKIRGTDAVRSAMDAAMGLYEREAQFYAEYADAVPIATPRCLYVGDGTATPLLIEDLGDLRMGNQMDGLSVADAERLIDALADMHARYWNDPPGFLVSPGEGMYAAMIAQLVGSGAAVLQERFAGRVGDGVLAAVGEHAPQWGTVLERCADGPPTFAHNDCRLDNVFFRADGEPVLVDWQTPARTRGTADVGNLLAGSMDADDADAHWEALLRRYHDGLVGHGVDGYSWDECVDHYRVSVLYALAPGIALLGSLDGTDDRGIGDAISFRALRHAEVLDSFAAL